MPVNRSSIVVPPPVGSPPGSWPGGARTRLLCAALLVFLCSSLAFAQLPIPKLAARITDQAGVLAPDERIAIEQELQQYADSTSNDFVVLIVPTLQGEDPADYAFRVAQENGVGTKSNNNGLLTLVAIDDRKIWITVGYGLEGAITDALTRLVIENEITPRFRAGDYADGIRAGLRALMQAAAGEYRAEPKSEAPEGIGLGTIVLLVIGFIVISRMFGGRGGGRRGGGGGGGGILPWIIASQLGSHSRGRGGGFGGGGFSSGGGGWSGGGGSFGGGGAGGSW